MLINILLYADDIALFAETATDLQSLLKIVETWCNNWQLEVNLSKTNIIHIRQKRKPQSNFTFQFNNKVVAYCQSYKYLGCFIDQHLDYKFTVDILADSAGKALSSVITKMIKNKGFPYSIYTMLYQACVSSVSLYGSEIYGYRHYESLFRLHLRAARAYLGLPKNVASFGLISELDWLLPRFQSSASIDWHLKWSDTSQHRK